MKRLLLLTAILALTACGGNTGTYRLKITVDPAQVYNTDQHNFPALVEVTNPALKSASNGGHVAENSGDDIYFTLLDGSSRIPYATVSYDPAQGRLKAWVRIPILFSRRNTEVYLYYGNPKAAGKKPKKPVWDEHYVLVRHKTGATAAQGEKPGTGGMTLGDALTVQAWVYSDAYCPEALQPLVAKWSILTSFDTFDAYDAGNTDGLKTIGFFGAVFDGRYVYFSPQRYGHEKDSTHGYALRFDTQGDFKDSSNWEAYDAGNTDGLPTRGHYGAVFDGRYVYFVPRGKNYGGSAGAFNEFQSNLLRYDTHMNFKDSAGWAAYDMGVDISKQSAAFDGRFIYFCPGYEHGKGDEIVGSSKIIRFDTISPFKDPSSYRVLDVSRLLRAETGNYDGAVFAGRYVYFVPLTSGVVLRYDTTGDYDAAVSWSTFDAKPLGMKMNVGAMFDGRFLYFAAYGNGIIVRYDTGGGFTDRGNWTSYDASVTGGLDTAGFDGGFFDGRYVYFAPFVSPRKDGGYNFHTNYLRYDTVGEFDNPSSWSSHDASAVDGLPTIGYNGGAFDGRFIYLAPWQDRTEGKRGVHGNVLRYDTVGNNGSFCLKYCDLGHNGGLTAAAPGPGFIVNTDRGPVSVAANESLLPGWHYIAGVYNGDTIKLFIDGILVAERSGSGRIRNNDIAVSIGSLAEGAAHFPDVIEEVRVSTIARSDDWIATEYKNLANPEGFISTGKEEAVK